MTTRVEPATPALWKTVIDEGWLKDPDAILNLGFGKGQEGALRATEALARVWHDQDPSQAPMGLYVGSEPVGFFVAEYLGVERKTVRLTPYRVPHEMLPSVLETLFDGSAKREFDVRRIEVELPVFSKSHIASLRENGFKQEARHRERLWDGNRRFDTVLMALLRWQWEESSREDKVN